MYQEGHLMRGFHRILNYSLSSTPIDLWLLRLAGWSVGLGVLVLMALTLPKHASSRTELLLGLGLAGLNCLVSAMFGTLSSRLHVASQAVDLPARSRIWEWSGYAAGVAVLVLGMWVLTTLPLTRAGFISAILLIFALALTTFNVGILFTLIRNNLPLADSSSCSSTGPQRT